MYVDFRLPVCRCAHDGRHHTVARAVNAGTRAEEIAILYCITIRLFLINREMLHFSYALRYALWPM
jgi:hypothetical protein